MDKTILSYIKRKYPAGTKIKLNSVYDFQASHSGTVGKVLGANDTGSLLLSWKTGSYLNLLFDSTGNFANDFGLVGD